MARSPRPSSLSRPHQHQLGAVAVVVGPVAGVLDPDDTRVARVQARGGGWWIGLGGGRRRSIWRRGRRDLSGRRWRLIHDGDVGARAPQGKTDGQDRDRSRVS